ncbi:acyloxyacyl hydrolase [Stappia sp. ES.058]|uniref:acyloxyacyl hydrolase n=1 Tax=Stappia sp. ES.058 TaxID=1881061 RepID=UPI00087DD4E1|nr:acyloxyacyl hydrolase [Stappia sp. ES.058]SDU39294.1 Lipid A 3-O-deacylase (PagL) [Stappia sp. ES.058]
MTIWKLAISAITCGILLNLSAPPAVAQDRNGPRVELAHALFLSEVRGGVLYHDTMGRENGIDINAEILSRFAALEFTTPFLDTRAMLRPHLGVNLNTAGSTSMAYFGYSLTVDLNTWLFVEGSFGGMFHNGNTGVNKPNTLSLGCSLLFREAASLGVRFSESVNLSAMIEHSSNAGGCTGNNGMTNVGMRLGYLF